MTMTKERDSELLASVQPLPDPKGNSRNGGLSLDELLKVRAREHVLKFGSKLCIAPGSITLITNPELGVFVASGFKGILPLVLRFTPDALDSLDHYHDLIAKYHRRNLMTLLGQTE